MQLRDKHDEFEKIGNIKLLRYIYKFVKEYLHILQEVFSHFS